MVDNRPLPGSADIFDAGLFRTAKDSARSSRAGTQGDFFVIHTPDLVLVVTLTCDCELAPVRQWRHGSSTASLEVPGRLHNGPTKHAAAAGHAGQPGGIFAACQACPCIGDGSIDNTLTVATLGLAQLGGHLWEDRL